ncbi:MAG: DUF1634 domain-containing protein [Bacillota bacterium]
MEKQNLQIAPEQIRYANILFYGAWGGILILGILFLLYASGIISPYVPSAMLPNYWGMNVHDFNEQLNLPVGWGWVGMLMYGDFLNFIGIAFLAFLTIAGYLVLIPFYIKSKDMAYAAIAGLEILILLLAASGVLRVGH